MVPSIRSQGGGSMTAKELEELIRTQGKAIYTFCYHLTQNKIDSDDLYQETFLKAFEQCDKIEKTNNPKSFLLSISVNVWKNQRKKYARRNRIAPQETSYEEWEPLIGDNQISPEEKAIHHETYKTVWQEVGKLEDKFKIPMYLYYTSEMSIESIAKLLHIPKGTVKSRLHKARTIMKQRLEESGYER